MSNYIYYSTCPSAQYKLNIMNKVTYSSNLLKYKMQCLNIFFQSLLWNSS